jgi:hypothetical protein
LLPPFIIEQIRQREERERTRRDDQPRLELPLPIPMPKRGPARGLGDGNIGEEEPDLDRGVIILDLG